MQCGPFRERRWREHGTCGLRNGYSDSYAHADHYADADHYSKSFPHTYPNHHVYANKIPDAELNANPHAVAHHDADAFATGAFLAHSAYRLAVPGLHESHVSVRHLWGW